MPENSTTPAVAPSFTMKQLTDLEAAQGLLRSTGLRAAVNPHYECGETIELARPHDLDAPLWLLNATMCGRVSIAALPSGSGPIVENLSAAIGVVVATERGQAEPAWNSRFL